MPNPMDDEDSPTAERILDAAERLFAELGFTATSLRAIAAEVGIQNPSIYAHFANKEALYEAVLDRALGPVLGEFWGADDEVELLTAHLAEHPAVSRLLLQEFAQGQPRPSVLAWIRRTLHQTEEWKAKSSRASKAATDDLTLRVLALVHIVTGFFGSQGLVEALTAKSPTHKSLVRLETKILQAVSETLFDGDRS